MSSLSRWIKTVRGVAPTKIVALFALAVVPVWLWADAPAWWAERGVLNPNATPDDYAAVNQGQVKNIAKQAYEAMKEHGVIDPAAAAASTNPDDPARRLFQAWQNPAASTDDYRAVNLGQLKNVADPFYAWLQELNYTGQPLASGQTRPWSGAADNYALANIGQVKNLFSFDLNQVNSDTDNDGLPDAWEIQHFNNLSQSSDGDPDNDGLTNLQEKAVRTNPNQFSSNGSGVSDGWQAANGFNPAQPFDGEADSDGDGLSDAEEARHGTNPHSNDTDNDGVPDADDGWPRHAWITTAPLPEVRYAVIRLRGAGFPTDLVWNKELDDSANVLGQHTDGFFYWVSATGTVETVPIQENNAPTGYGVIMKPARRLGRNGHVIGTQVNSSGWAEAVIWRSGETQASSLPMVSSGDQKSSVPLMVNGSGKVVGHQYTWQYSATDWWGDESWGGTDFPGWLGGQHIAALRNGEWQQGTVYNALALNEQGWVGVQRETYHWNVNGGVPPAEEAPWINPRVGILEGNAFSDIGPGLAYDWYTGLPPDEWIKIDWITSGTPAVAVGHDQTTAPWWAHKAEGAWAREAIEVWDPVKQAKIHLEGLGSMNDRFEILTTDQVAGPCIIRNGVIRPLADLIPSGWSLPSEAAKDINNHGVILAEARRTLDDQGQPISNPQSEPVLLVPYEILTRDPSTASSSRQHTEVVASASPAPEVELHLENAEITASGNLSVTVSGRVTDPLSEVLGDSTQRVAKLHLKVDGQSVGTPIDLTYTAVSDPLRLVSSETTFEQTVVISNPKPRGYTIVAETDANAAGKTGWDKAAIGVDAEMIRYSGADSKISIVFDQAPSAGVIDSAVIYFGTRAPLAGDGSVTETAAGSGLYTGTLKVGTQTATCTVQLRPTASPTASVIDNIEAHIQYQVPGQPVVTSMGIWQETGVATLHFLPDGYSSAGERLVANHTEDLPGSAPVSFEPVVMRIGVPAAWAQASGFGITVNGQNCTLKELTYNGVTSTYVVANASATHPRIFVASPGPLPADIAVANAAGENDTIDWTLSLGGNSALKVQTQVVAGPTTLAGELVASYIQSRPHWVSTEPGAGAGGSGGSTLPGWHAPGDTITDTDLRTAYAFIYPDNFSKLLLQVYDSEGHHIELGDVLGDYDFEAGWTHPSDGKMVIQIEDDDSDINPCIAAQYLWQGLNKAHDTDLPYRAAVAEAAGSGALLEQAYQTWHANAGREAARAGVAAAELYLSGIGILNEPADWILVINDVSEGHYIALAAALPFVPRALVAAKPLKILSKTTGKVLDTIADAARLERLQEIYLVGAEII